VKKFCLVWLDISMDGWEEGRNCGYEKFVVFNLVYTMQYMGEPKPFKFELKKDPIFREEKQKIELPPVSFSSESVNESNFDGEGGAVKFSLLNEETKEIVGVIKYDYPKRATENQLLKIRGVGIDSQKYAGQGFGIQLYEKLLELAHDRDLDGISSDSIVQGGALAVWKKLVEAGHAVDIHPDALEKWKAFIQTYDDGKYFKESISVQKNDAVFKMYE